MQYLIDFLTALFDITPVGLAALALLVALAAIVGIVWVVHRLSPK